MSRRNLPTAEGRLLGAEIARLVDGEEAKLRATNGPTPPRCQGCAATAGSEANGCGETLIKFIGSLGVGEGPFYCHAGLDLEHDPDPQPKLICRAWVACADPREVERVQDIMREARTASAPETPEAG